MLCVGSLISGIINGLFASGAGQILVFMLIYFLKIDTHKARATSIFLIGVITVISFIRYLFIIDLKTNDMFIVVVSGLFFGVIGSKIMKRIDSNWLNLISGLVITTFCIYSIIRGS